jgi:hypothetical protein
MIMRKLPIAKNYSGRLLRKAPRYGICIRGLVSQSCFGKVLIMAVHVYTPQPSGLLLAIKKAIDEKRVETWTYDSDGDFTHVPLQWYRKAWLRPSVQSGLLVLNTLTPGGTRLSREVYGVYHGRFIEMLLAHFDTSFSTADATALATVADSVSA